MGEKKKWKPKRRDDEPEKPSKEEYAVAKYMRFNTPVRDGKLVDMEVKYFIASKAIDVLLESKFAKTKEPLFTSRQHCVDYCNELLLKGMFHRALKIERKKDKEKEAKRQQLKKRVAEAEESGKDEKSKSKKNKKEESSGKEESKEVEKKDDKKDEEKKKKRKTKLEMHDSQLFKDGEEIYVWIYDPVPVKTFLIGLVLVLGAIGVCLFPLWPPEVRLGVYYLSLAAAGFLGVIFTLCIIRFIVFCLVWLVSFGRHHFWLLPNLTEDVGFFDSFKPLYKYEYKAPASPDTKPQQDKSSDQETEEGAVVKEETSPSTVRRRKGENKISEEKQAKATSKKENIQTASSQEEEEDMEDLSGTELEDSEGYEVIDSQEGSSALDDYPSEKEQHKKRK